MHANLGASSVICKANERSEAIERGSVSGEEDWGGQNQHSDSAERKTSRTSTPNGPAELAVDTMAGGLGFPAKGKLKTEIPVQTVAAARRERVAQAAPLGVGAPQQTLPGSEAVRKHAENDRGAAGTERVTNQQRDSESSAQRSSRGRSFSAAQSWRQETGQTSELNRQNEPGCRPRPAIPT